MHKTIMGVQCEKLVPLPFIPHISVNHYKKSIPKLKRDTDFIGIIILL